MGNQSEVINQRRTENTMAKRKRINKDLQTNTQSLSNTNPNLKLAVNPAA